MVVKCLKWEYTTMEIQPKDYSSSKQGETIDELGEQGWELVTILSYSGTQIERNFGLAFFKRKKKED